MINVLLMIIFQIRLAAILIANPNKKIYSIYMYCLFSLSLAASVAQSVRAFASHVEGWLFKSWQRQT